MAHISIIDISKTEGSIEFKFKTEFDSNFRRGVGDRVYLGEYYKNFLIESRSCPEVVGNRSIFVEGADYTKDMDRLSVNYTKFLVLNTAIHIFNSGIITGGFRNIDSEPDECAYDDLVEDGDDE